MSFRPRGTSKQESEKNLVELHFDIDTPNQSCATTFDKQDSISSGEVKFA
jgi:hypothetical protein